MAQRPGSSADRQAAALACYSSLDMTEECRAGLVVCVLSSTSLSTFGISWRFWTPYRTYPEVPYVPGLHATGFSVALLIAACLGLILACVPRLRVVALLVFVLCTIFLILEDQSRLQPYLYVELMVGIGLIYYTLNGRDLNGIRIALVLVYFWTGIQKLNVHYFREVFPWVISSGTHCPSLGGHPRLLAPLALATALLEIAVGLLLLWPRTRRYGIAAVIFVHASALFLIGPFGMNYAPVVWPWNIAMIAYVWILFRRYDRSILRVRDPIHVLAIVLFGLLPILNLFSLWDDYLSFHAFSGSQMDAYLRVPKGTERELPATARRALQGGKVWFANWSLSDNGASAYPAERIYHSVFRRLCITAPDLELVIVSKPEWPSGRTTEAREECPEKP